MKLRTLTEADVTITLTVEQEEMPVRGNYMASDEPALDRQAEDEILARLNDGDIWAWAVVTVTAAWEGFEASDSLGGCSYADEKDFVRDGASDYYADMKAEAIARLNEKIVAMVVRLATLAE